MASGRQPHNRKITVYLTDDELVEVESLKLDLLRRDIRTDRGRLVRALIEIGLQNDKDIDRLLKEG